MHITPIQLRFNDIDQMGHVNNAVIMEFFDLGKSEYFTAIGLPPEEGEFTVMVVHVEVDFQRQIRYHDKIHVTTTVDHFGKKSLAMKQQVINTIRAYSARDRFGNYLIPAEEQRPLFLMAIIPAVRTVEKALLILSPIKTGLPSQPLSCILR